MEREWKEEKRGGDDEKEREEGGLAGSQSNLARDASAGLWGV